MKRSLGLATVFATFCAFSFTVAAPRFARAGVARSMQAYACSKSVIGNASTYYCGVTTGTDFNVATLNSVHFSYTPSQAGSWTSGGITRHDYWTGSTFHEGFWPRRESQGYGLEHVDFYPSQIQYGACDLDLVDVDFSVTGVLSGITMTTN